MCASGPNQRKSGKPRVRAKFFFFFPSFFWPSRSTLTGPSIIVHSTEEEPDGVPDVEEEVAEGQAEDDVIEETMFTFESFELVRGRARGAVIRTSNHPC